MAQDRLAVILTTWHRLARLGNVLEDLSDQTFQDFDLYIWNNNPAVDKATFIDAKCDEYADRYPITTIHADQNYYGRGRMILARHLRLRHGYEYVHFVDDDQRLQPGTLTRVWDEKQPTTLLAQRVWKPCGPQIWPTASAMPGEYGMYGATTGATVDAKLFCHRQFWALWPRKFWQVDSLWASIMARALGWRILRSSLNLTLEGHNDGNALHKTGMYSALWKELADLYNGPQQGRYDVRLYEGRLP